MRTTKIPQFSLIRFESLHNLSLFPFAAAEGLERATFNRSLWVSLPCSASLTRDAWGSHHYLSQSLRRQDSLSLEPQHPSENRNLAYKPSYLDSNMFVSQTLEKWE